METYQLPNEMIMSEKAKKSKNIILKVKKTKVKKLMRFNNLITEEDGQKGRYMY
jgi:hypothetical protein